MMDIALSGVGSLRLAPDNVFRILLLDDQDDWLATTRDYLLSLGVLHVDIARSIEEAVGFLRRATYDGVLADVLLTAGMSDPFESMRGDSWLLQQEWTVGTTFKAAVTGFPELIAEPGQMAIHDIDVVKKGTPGEILYLTKLSEAAKSKTRRVLATAATQLFSLSDAGASEVSGGQSSTGAELMSQMATVFIAWARSRSDRSDQTVWVGARAYSPEELAEEVGRRSVVGVQVLGMFVRHMSYEAGVLESPFGDEDGQVK
ncbi:MAG: hypothetical protein AAB403_07285 [Planctomycetota bacterium]